MSESGAGRPAARAITPPHDSSEGDAVSTARLVTPMAERVPESVGCSAEGDWASFGTAPTLLLTQPQHANGENAGPSPAMVPPTMLEEQPWFRTGTTVAPPSMRPPAESVAPSPVRHSPNARVLKIVAGVLAGCLLIVAVAGVKLLYLRIRGPVPTPAPTAQPTVPVAPAVVAEPAAPAPSAPERTKGNLGEAQTAAPSSAQASPPAPVTRTAPARSSPAPARTTTKPATRRAPVTKKVVRSH
jgi:ribonuclease E